MWYVRYMPAANFQVKETPFFKINKKTGWQIIDLRKQFGFLPERIVIERMTSRNNVIRIIAVVPPKEVKKEKDMTVK